MKISNLSFSDSYFNDIQHGRSGYRIIQSRFDDIQFQNITLD